MGEWIVTWKWQILLGVLKKNNIFFYRTGDFFEGNLAEDKFDQASVDKALEELPKIA